MDIKKVEIKKEGPGNISFVVPAYNAAHTIEAAVRSILEGNFEPGDEVIIVNDSSSDSTEAIAERLAWEFAPNISVITNKENKGCAASRNVGVTTAKNDLIFNLDADNILVPKSIQALKEAMTRARADAAAFGEYLFFKTSTKSVDYRWVCKPGIFTMADLLCGVINAAPGGNYLYRKAVWQNMGGYWEFGRGFYEAHESWAFSLKLLMHNAKFIIVPGTSYFHRYSHSSLSMRERGRTESSKLIEIIRPLLNEQSQTLLSNNHDWIIDIGHHPLFLKNGQRGKDGAIVFNSPVKQTMHAFRGILSAIVKRTKNLHLPRDIEKNFGYACIYAESLLWKRKSRTLSKKRVLIMRMDGIGDCILFYPTLRAYREFYKDAEITLVFPEPFKELSPLIEQYRFDTVIWFSHHLFKSSFLYRRHLMIGLGRTNYDVFIYPAPSRESVGYFMMKMIRATERIGFGGDITEHGKKLEEMGALTYTKLIRPPENIKAEIDRYVYFTEQVTGKKIDVEFPTIDIKKLSDCKALELLKVNDLENKKYAIMFPGAGAPYRIWPPEKSAQIVNYIRNKGMTVVMCGGDKEKALVRDIMSLANKNQQDDGQNVIADLSGKTDLATLAHLLAKSQFYFGSDTGILHLAVAVGTPAVATVGSGGLDRFFPYGDLKKNRVVCDRTHSFVRSYTPGDWSDAHFLKPNEIHPSIKNITTEDAEKEVDYMIDYTS